MRVASNWPPRQTPSVGTWWRTALRRSPPGGTRARRVAGGVRIGGLVAAEHDQGQVPVQRLGQRVAGVRAYDGQLQARLGEPVTQPAEVVGRIVLDYQCCTHAPRLSGGTDIGPGRPVQASFPPRACTRRSGSRTGRAGGRRSARRARSAARRAPAAHGLGLRAVGGGPVGHRCLLRRGRYADHRGPGRLTGFGVYEPLSISTTGSSGPRSRRPPSPRSRRSRAKVQRAGGRVLRGVAQGDVRCARLGRQPVHERAHHGPAHPLRW